MATKEKARQKKTANKEDEERYCLTPKGCLKCAIDDVLGCGTIDDTKLNLIWLDFADIMKRHGYVEDEKEEQK